ncbi:DUF2062 domain-containing protein [Micavibrio aeruginosavorus]|uniref:DUF2062 domain-containing protein n=1 Tax=Micavibrio aeruginosavorus TaxID=349221 RepID=UPI003F4AE77A
MLFRRRTKLHPIKRLREILWPSMGWGRTWDYIRHRMFRRSDSSYSITAGIATGVAISFSPLIGTHFVQAALVAYVLRANLFAAVLGTLFGNPTTFPLIWWMSYELGEWVFGLFGYTGLLAIPAEGLQLSYLLAHPYKLLLPMMVGGYLLAIVSWFVSYVFFYWPVKQMQKAYHAERLQKLRDKILHREHAERKKDENAD